jgi:DMSO/TMAO reductase YedYZ molybdopterin-dependent catalytic subunit
MPQEQTQLRDGRIVRSEAPLNLEMPFSSVDSFLTPTKSFYVRTHFPIPVIDRNTWWLYVEGEVEKPFAINYQQLTALESRSAPVTLECAGNNRNFLEPKVKGVQWHLGAVSTAEWTGVPLSVLLDRAVPKPNACDVVLEGADHGILDDPRSPPGELKFARSIPLEKARGDVLLAYKWFPVARRRTWLVRNGIGQMAPADHRHRSRLQRILSNVRLRVLEEN